MSVRKKSKNIEESGVTYVRKVKYRSQSYSPVKREKKYDHPKFQYRQTSDNQKNTQRLLPLWKSTLGHGLSLSYKKNVKTAINSDLRAHSVETEKELKTESDIQKARTSQTYKKRGRVRHTKSEDESDKVVRKYITVKVLNKSVRFQLDSGSDISIINLQTRKLEN